MYNEIFENDLNCDVNKTYINVFYRYAFEVNE